MRQLFLGDLKGQTEAEVREHIVIDFISKNRLRSFSEWEMLVFWHEIDKYDILVAYESIGDQRWLFVYSLLILKNKKTGLLAVNTVFNDCDTGFSDKWRGRGYNDGSDLYQYYSFRGYPGLEGRFSPKDIPNNYFKEARHKEFIDGADTESVKAINDWIVEHVK